MKTILINILLLAYFSAASQNTVESVLSEIGKNNTTLSALRKNSEAEMIANKTGIWPVNPEVEFHYLWGNPSPVGSRTDFAVSQSFDFPTAYVYRSQVADFKNQQAGLEYQKQRRDILHEARMLCGELTFHNALVAEYRQRVDHATQIAEAYKKMLEAGEGNQLDFNKSRIYLLNVSKKYETLVIERTALQAELARLNGGMAIAFADSIFEGGQSIPGFEEWYAQAEQNNPVLQWLKQELSISHKTRQLQVAQSLPKFSAGYMSEKIVGEQFQGITVGISIPLWENKNTVAYTKAKILAVEELQRDAKLQFYNEIKAHHAKLFELQQSIEGYRKEIAAHDNGGLILKALDAGEISLSEYFYELSFYFESIDKLLEMELTLDKAWAELLRYT